MITNCGADVSELISMQVCECLERTHCASFMLEVFNSTESLHSLNVQYVTDKRSLPCVE